jgi:putative Mg2+ transporter-C (MgtC) family protein
MLVTVGSCLVVLAPAETGVKVEHLMRVVQGLAAGIGFLGAGAILKMSEERKIHGLTTAASVWVMAAVGMSVGLGMLWPALLAVLLCELVLTAAHWVDLWVERRGGAPQEEK